MSKTFYLTLAFTLVIVAAWILRAEEGAQNPLVAYIPKNMKSYYLEMLLVNAKPPAELDAAQSVALKQKHLAYIRSQIEAGKYVVAGPLTDENHLKAIGILQAASLQEAQSIAKNDPMIQSGQMTAEIHPVLLEDLSAVHADYPPLP
jgi:uncharacterized protein YciI